MNENMKIVVVYGGVSSEREVSLRSGAAVYNGLLQYGYKNVTLFDLKEDNVADLIAEKPDVVYLALHGQGGEDGCIQGVLELAGIPYTGPGVATSAICMNKVFTKQVLCASNIPTADYLDFDITECADRDSISKQIMETLGLPVVLKSPCQGSSIGVVIVRKAEEMRQAIEEIFTYGDQLLAEAYLEGTEITLPIIGNRDITLLPDIEITSERDFYDFTAKYTTGLCHHIIPSRISEEDRCKIKEIGARTYRKLKCRGVSRIDFIIDKEKGPMVIEVNTLPGMTEMSLVPDAAKAVDISFAELVARIVEFALEK